DRNVVFVVHRRDDARLTQEVRAVADTKPAQSEGLLDNEVVRVTRWTLAPGESIGWHRHEFPYVVVPLAGGRLTFKDANAETPVELVAGNATFRPAGIEHEVLNRGHDRVSFVDTEIKGPRLGWASRRPCR